MKTPAERLAFELATMKEIYDRFGQMTSGERDRVMNWVTNRLAQEAAGAAATEQARARAAGEAR